MASTQDCSSEGTRKKRKYTRRAKTDSLRLITDITELTESIAEILVPPDESISSAGLGDVNFSELEDSVWVPQKIVPTRGNKKKKTFKSGGGLNAKMKLWHHKIRLCLLRRK